MMSVAFRPLRILDVVRETDDAIALTLAPDDAHAEEFAFTPGQHLTFRAEIEGEDVRRNYSICVEPGGPLKVAIKRVDGGAFSNWAVKNLTSGATIYAMAPRGHFTWEFNPRSRHHYLAFAAGSGITPVLSLIRAGLTKEPESNFTLLYGNRSSASIMFLEQLAALKNKYIGRLQVYHFLTAEIDDVELFNGRRDAARIADVLTWLVEPSSIDVAFICGPEKMMDAAEQAMLDAGLTPDKILTERFASERGLESQSDAVRKAREKARGLQIEVRIDGRRRLLEFDPDKGSILESARAAGLQAPFACKAGVCATCRAKLVSGEVSMAKNYGLSAAEVNQGYILTCQAIPTTADVAVDYDS